MGFKVYNGYRLNGVTSLDQMVDIAEELRRVANECAKQAMYEAAVQKAVSCLDNHAMGKANGTLFTLYQLDVDKVMPDLVRYAGKAHAVLGDIRKLTEIRGQSGIGPAIEPWWFNELSRSLDQMRHYSDIAEHAIIERTRSPIDQAYSWAFMEAVSSERTSRRMASFDPDASMVVYRDKLDGAFYAQLFIDQTQLRDAITSRADFEACPYWDDEPPEGTTDEAWDERRELWDRLLGQSSVPSLAGTTFQLSNAYSAVMTTRATVSELRRALEHIPPREARAETLATRAWEGRYAKHLIDVEKMSVFEALTKASKARKSISLVDETRAIAAVLYDITEDMLTEPLNEQGQRLGRDGEGRPSAAVPA